MKRVAQLADWRVLGGPMPSTEADGNNGAFVVPYRGTHMLQCIAADGMGWEHVSVVPIDRHRQQLYRTPTWDEMCFVKRLFWADDECVVQFHPPKALYRNAHPYCLHLWKPIGIDVPMPLPIMVAPADVTVAEPVRRRATP